MSTAVRTEAGEVEVGTESCFRHLVETLGDPDPRARLVAVCGLAASGDARAVDHILSALEDEHPAVRERAAVALGRIGDRRAAPGLLAAVQRPDAALHRAAIAALGELGPVAVDVLEAELGCSDPKDRVGAAIALGETRDMSAVDPLTGALEDPDPTVRFHAREALDKIAGSPFL
jgi:HEAT repeat protein